MSTENKNVKTEEKADASITIEPVEFASQASCLYRNTVELCDMVGSVFGQIFPDYVGCKIVKMDPMINVGFLNSEIPLGDFFIDLVFKQKSRDPDEDKDNIVPINSNGKKNDLLERANNLLGPASTKAYRVTEWTKAVLEKLLPNPKNPRWNERIGEYAIDSTNSYGMSNKEIIVKIMGIPLISMINLIYGTEVKHEDGSKTLYQYMITPIRQINSIQPAGNGYSYAPRNKFDEEWLVQIQQSSPEVIKELNASIGGPNFGYNNPMYHPYNG